MKELSQQIEQFYEDDKVSRMCPGKRDFVKKGSLKKQRRVLLLPLQELHKMFREETKCKISFSTFTRARPFWVSLPKKSDRETCACIKHTNFELLVSALKQSKVIAERNPCEVIKSVVCSIDKENCLMGKCEKCKNNKIKFTYENEFKLKFFKWKKVLEEKVIRNKKKVLKKTKKVKVLKTISKVESDFYAELKDFKKHVHYAKHQIDAINAKLNNLSTDELVFRIDFSENYITKLANEVQSYHFGASKPQLSINTGLRYAKVTDNVQSFCFATVSDNTDHQAHAIWAHMDPILKESAKEFPNTKTVHFFSDSPSNQYRNRFNIHLFQNLIPKYFKCVDTMTWNYTEAGHGKGPMDGVGGTLKRMCDRKVSYGEDIMCSKDFVKALEDSKIYLVEVLSEDIEKMKKELSQLKIDPIVGIMKVNQFTFSSKRMYDARELTCFKCPPRKKCSHYGIGVVPAGGTSSIKKNKQQVLSSPKPGSSSKLSKPFYEKAKLTIEDVYTSSEDEECPSKPDDKPVYLQDFVDSINNEKIHWENLQPGDYVLVQYSNEKKKSQVQHYVGICQSKVSNNELDVTFMKQLTKEFNMYYVDENDFASVPTSQIKAILPQPTIIVKGCRVFYKFVKL